MTDKKDDLNSFVATTDDLTELLEMSLAEEVALDATVDVVELNTPTIALKVPSNEVTVRIEPRIINPAQDREEDYDFARKNLKDIINISIGSLEELKGFCEQAQSARAYEVLGGVVNSIVEANKKLLELHKQRQELDLKEKESKEGSKKVTNNNLFVGSSAQLLELAKQLKKATDTE